MGQICKIIDTTDGWRKGKGCKWYSGGWKAEAVEENLQIIYEKKLSQKERQGKLRKMEALKMAVSIHRKE
jgi:hypothetical protein